MNAPTHALLMAVVAWLCLVALRAAADEPPAAQGKSASASDVRQGRLNFNGFCSRCHGMDAKGAKGPNLTTGRFRHGSSDEAIVTNIKNGIRGTGMPGFPFDDDFLLPVVSFLRAGQQPVATSALPGDKERGRRLFAEHNCAACHWTGSDGGRRGPDLSRWRGDEAFFHRKIADPDHDVDPQYQRVALRLLDGRLLAGVRLYEDSYHLLLIDDQETLRSIPLADIEELARPPQSLMPRTARQLMDQERRDLLEFINSLAEGPQK